MIVKCPSGLEVEIRKLKGKEADALADRKMARKGETFDAILTGCWVRTLNPGPYKPEENKPPHWGKVLVCDRFVILMAIRTATYGPTYAFSAVCDEKERGCGHRFEWEVDLQTQLPIFDLPESSREAIARGENRFVAEVDGRRVTFKLQEGSDEHKAGKKLAENRHRIMTVALANRILEVEGVNRARVESWVSGLDLDLQLDLMAEMEKADGGVETQIEIECPQCDRTIEVSPPFEGADFWLPRRQSRKKSRDGRESRTLTTAGSPEEEMTTEETETT